MVLTDNLDSTYTLDLKATAKQLKKGDMIKIIVDNQPFTEMKLTR
jgi:TusA-related sulfurtransferase